MKIPLSTLSANLSLYVLNDVKLPLEPVLPLDVSFLGFATTKFTLHNGTYNAYTVITSIFDSSLNRQIT